MEQQHSQFRVLVNEKSKSKRQVPSDFVFGAFHFEKIVVIKPSTSSEEAVVDELTDIFTRRVDSTTAIYRNLLKFCRRPSFLKVLKSPREWLWSDPDPRSAYFRKQYQHIIIGMTARVCILQPHKSYRQHGRC